MRAVVLRRLLGVAFLVVVTLLLAATVVTYRKAWWFQDVVRVDLQARRIGHQLITPADVKLRGIIVGQVRDVRTENAKAVLELSLDPGKVDMIPSNVSARILPKTLFGEKYVDLVLPAQPSGRHIANGDVIPEDRSKVAIELETVLNDLLPVLQALKPAQLSSTLTALADALRGQGDRLGANLVRVDSYFKEFNQDLDTFVDDISGLADLANNYNAAAPDLLETLRNFTRNAQTLTAKDDTFAAFLRGTAAFADTATRVVSRNADDIVELAAVSRPTLATLARYSPEFTCLIVGLDKVIPLLDATFSSDAGSKPGLNITLEVLPTQPQEYRYPQDRPSYNLRSGPNCKGLPNSPVSNAFPEPLNPGAASLMRGSVSSAADLDLVAALAAPVLQVPSDQIPDVIRLLAWPLMRGTAVSYS